MRRLRALLFAVEIGAKDVDKDYIKLAIDMQLITGMAQGHNNYPAVFLQLTPAGHDFIALARNDEIWEKVEGLIKERVGDTPFGIWVALLEQEHKRRLLDNGD